MATLKTVTMTTGLLISPSAFAHNGTHPDDPNLHVNPQVEDCEVEFAPDLGQEAYARFAREFGSLSAFKQASGPLTVDRWHVSVGLEQERFTVEEKSDAWNDTFSHPDANHELGAQKTLPKIKVRVGVSDSTDVGAFYTMNPISNYGWVGVDAKHALLRQSEGLPITLSVRGAYTKTLFVSDMDMHALTGNVSAGRTLWDRVTPYVGTGADIVLARETSDQVELATAVPVAPLAFGGIEASLWRLSLGIEGQLAAVNSAQVTASAVF